MRILHISAQKPGGTGSGIYLRGLIGGMNRLDIDQALLAGVSKYDDRSYINELGIKKFYPVEYNTDELPFDVLGMSDNMPYPATRYRDLTDEMLELVKEAYTYTIERAVDEFKPDIVLCHHLYLVSALAVEVVKNYNHKYGTDIKIGGICHGTCLRQLNSIKLENRFIGSMIPELDYIFALHGSQKEDIERMFRVYSKRVHVIGSGYNSLIFNKDEEPTGKYVSEDKFSIAYAGKISLAKGLLQLMDSLKKTGIPKNRLIMRLAGGASDSSEQSLIEEAARKSGYEIEFLGNLKQDELADLFRSSDLFILPSFYEGLPVVILEALACGTHIATTDITGVRPWLEANLDSMEEIDFIKLPRLVRVDEPLSEDIDDFENDIAEVLSKDYKRVMDESGIHSIGKRAQTDLKRLSWQGLSESIIRILAPFIGPYDPDISLKLCILSSRLCNRGTASLKRRRTLRIDAYKHDGVYEGISEHADLTVCPIKRGKIVVAPESYEYYMEKINELDEELREQITVIKGETQLSKSYPRDIPYNLVIIGDRAIHNFDYTDPVLLKEIEREGLKKIHVKQGYTKCSVCVVGDKAAITSDKGIYDALKAEGIDTLLISKGSIILEGMDYGFIGGASANLSFDEIGFFGCIEDHPDYEEIDTFLNKHKKKCLSGSMDMLEDFGSLIPIL